MHDELKMTADGTLTKWVNNCSSPKKAVASIQFINHLSGEQAERLVRKLMGEGWEVRPNEGFNTDNPDTMVEQMRATKRPFLKAYKEGQKHICIWCSTKPGFDIFVHDAAHKELVERMLA